MKAKNIFALLGLSFVMAAGAFAGLKISSVKEADAWSGPECGDTWYICGTINGQNWDNFNGFTHNAGKNRYEYTFEDATQVEFKLFNVQAFSGGIEINAGYGADLDWAGKGWTSLTNNNGGNFQTKAAGKYTVYYADNITGYENGVWAFGIEVYVEPFDPSTAKFYYKVGDGDWSVSPMTHNTTGTDDRGTYYEYLINGLSVTAGTNIYFKKGTSEVIHPIASLSRSYGANNLMWSSSSEELMCLVGCTSSLRLFVYDTGYDAYLGGYVADNHTFYFTNNENWAGTPKVYVFDNFNNHRDEWPGIDMTFVDVDGDEHSRYSFVLDANRWVNYVVSGGGDQTENLSYSMFTGIDDGIYLIGGSTFGAREVGYYHYVEAVYSLQVGGSSYTLQPHEGSEYVVEDIALTAGQEIAYSYDGVAQASTAKAVNNNNLSSAKKVIKSVASADVYVDVSAKTIWAEGLQPALDNGYHLYHGTTVVPLVYDEGSEQYQSTNISFAVNDELRFIHVFDDHAPDIFGTATPGGDLAANFSYDGEKGCIVCVTACNAGVYFKPGDPNYAYFGIVDTSLVDATNFANGFNSAIGGVCVADGSTNKESLWTAWAAQKTAASSLSAAAKLILQTADSHHDVEAIANFAAKYDYVATKYGNFFNGKDSGYNFINRSITPISSYNGVFFGEMTSSSMISIVSVITFVSISAICVLVIYKKKRHN